MLPVSPAQLKSRYQEALRLMQAGRLTDAQERFLAVWKVVPKQAEVPFQLGRIAQLQGRHAEAADWLERARALEPQEPAILTALVEAYDKGGNTAAALKVYDALIARDPKAAKPRADKAIYLQRLGDFEAAEKEFRAAIRRNPFEGALYRSFLGSKKLKAGDPLIADMLKAWKHPRLSREGRVQFGFALGKAMEDIGAHDRVFGFLTAANAAQREANPFDIRDRETEIDALLAALDPLPEPEGDAPEAPIFITGMPRSGTTLAEQIVAAHPHVTAGGEIVHAVRLAYLALNGPKDFKPATSLPKGTWAKLGRDYIRLVRRDMTFGQAFTDKGIQSHLMLGLLRCALPKARFVVVRRDPRDIALSIYKNHFGDGTHRYSNDLRDIARYMKTFDRCVRHWQDRMGDAVHVIHYEDLVADPEPHSRALVAAAGLDWDPACLEFHKAKSSVKTLSLHQVRQPIYKASAQAWKKYEADLAPFIDEWEKD